MLKTILILVLAVYLLSKAGKYFSGIFGSTGPNQGGGQQPNYRNPEPKVNRKPQKGKFDNYKGGEYVDYEEVD